MIQNERMHIIDTQKIILKDFDVKGRVLDIGGGGEGVIGQLLGEKVIAIDSRQDELNEAPEGPIKIIMDARELKFLDKSFDVIISFFTLMYINIDFHFRVFQEIYRVLKDNGEFMLWDVRIPKYKGGIKDIFIIPLDIEMKDRSISPTYGVSWEGSEQNLSYFIQLGETIGFQTIFKEESGEIYFLKFKKLCKNDV